MPFRTDGTQVRGIIQVDDEEFDLDPFIETANLVVTALCSSFAYTDIQLEMIERWLSAHLYSCDHSRLMEQVIGRARDLIQGKIGLGLQLTHHGQQLYNGIDFLGSLSSFGQPRKKVKVTWLGAPNKHLNPYYPYYYGNRYY